MWFINLEIDFEVTHLFGNMKTSHHISQKEQCCASPVNFLRTVQHESRVSVTTVSEWCDIDRSRRNPILWHFSLFKIIIKINRNYNIICFCVLFRNLRLDNSRQDSEYSRCKEHFCMLRSLGWILERPHPIIFPLKSENGGWHLNTIFKRDMFYPVNRQIQRINTFENLRVPYNLYFFKQIPCKF